MQQSTILIVYQYGLLLENQEQEMVAILNLKMGRDQDLVQFLHHFHTNIR